MGRKTLANEFRRKNVGFSISPVTQPMLKTLAETMPFPEGDRRSEGRVIDVLVYHEFIGQITSRILAEIGNAAGPVAYEPEKRRWSLLSAAVTFAGVASEGSVTFDFDDRIHGQQKTLQLPCSIPAIAESIANFLAFGFGEDPRRRGFPEEAAVWFFPSYNSTGKQIPITVTFIAGEQVEFFTTEGDRLLPIPPLGTGVYIKLPDGREYRGTLAAGSVQTMPNGTEAMALAVKALGP